MIPIRLTISFKRDHLEIPAGMVIAVPAEKAHELVSRGVAEHAEPQHAVVEPQETRELELGEVEQRTYGADEIANIYRVKPRRGRPPKSEPRS
jgi:hypothetical protein